MKNFVIIGGSTGIGEALVDILAQNGANVYASYSTTPKDDQSNITYFKFDATEDDLNMELFPLHIDGVVYCPGSINLKPFHRFKKDDFLADYNLQVVGAAAVIKQLLPLLKASSMASVVLFSTVAVQHGFAFHSLVSASKGAIEGLTRALAAELAPKIRVNAIAPSLTNTPLAGKLLSTPEKIEKQASINPLKKVGEAKDIAQAARFLLSDESSWVTGQVLPVDGGYSVIK